MKGNYLVTSKVITSRHVRLRPRLRLFVSSSTFLAPLLLLVNQRLSRLYLSKIKDILSGEYCAQSSLKYSLMVIFLACIPLPLLYHTSSPSGVQHTQAVEGLQDAREEEKRREDSMRRNGRIEASEGRAGDEWWA